MGAAYPCPRLYAEVAVIDTDRIQVEVIVWT